MITIITNGRLILEDEMLEGYDLVIEGQNIKDIIKTGERERKYSDYKLVNAHGGHVAPGFIDIHSDYIEFIASPRPMSLMDFNLALREAERELISHGVTTMYHSLSLYKITQAYNKPIRNKENVDRLITLIKESHNKKHLLRHRFHARFEMDNVESVDELLTYITEGKVNLLSFMDHTPGQGQFHDIKKYKKMTKSYGNRMSDKEIDEEIARRQNLPRLTPEDCKRIAEIAREHNVSIASHDDDSIEKLYQIKEYGTTISEFPITMEVAEKAHEMGFYTSAGTPNILLGGSHSGNLSAHEAIEKGVIKVLCSDYYPASILHSVFKLHRDYGHDLVEIFKLVSVNPAKAVNIFDEIGSLEAGKRADIIIIETIENDFPVITNCFVEGSHVLQVNYRD